MKLPKLAIENYQFTLIVVILLALLGGVALLTMPRSEDPQVTQPKSNVIVIYPGTSPNDMEQLVIDPIEEALNELDDVKKIESFAANGVGVVETEFLFGEDPDDKHADVVQKINSIREELPDDILRIDFNRFSIADYVNIFQLAIVSEEASYAEIEREADILKKRLETVSGIRKVRQWALPEQEVHVSVDLQKIASLHLPLDRVFLAIQSNNANIPGGSIYAGGKRFSVKTSGSYESLEDVKNTIVHAANGRIVYLKDVADVTFGYEDENYLARLNGRRAAFLTATQKDRTNIYNVMEGVRAEVENFAGELPESMSLEWVFDQSESVQERLDSFSGNLLQGVLLVGLVMLLILGARASLIVIIAIPISILIGLGFLDLNGFGIEQMSITGFVIALGLLVDNAIVVVENVSRYLKKGYGFREAAIRGTGQIAWAIVSATATSILAFLPMILMQNPAGEFIKSMPVTVVYTLAASLLISLILTPFLASRFLKKNGKSKGRLGERVVTGFVSTAYRGSLRWALDHPKLTVLAAGLVFVGSLALFPLVGVSLFPKAEKAQMFVNVEAPEGTSVVKTDEIAREVENILAQEPEIRSIASNIGHGNPVIYYNTNSRSEAQNHAQLYVALNHDNMKKMAELIERLREKFAAIPEARVEIKEFEQGPPVEAPIAFYVVGEELEVLEALAADVAGMIKETPDAVNIHNPMEFPKTDVHVSINREKAGMYGAALADVDRTVRAAISGVPVSQFRQKDGDKRDIVVRLPISERPQLSDFDKIYISSVTGGQIPLNQLARIEFETNPAQITHVDLERSVLLTADVAGERTVDEVTQEVLQKLDAYEWPKGYRYTIGGELESREESFGGMAQAITTAMVAIFGVLVLQFRSFTQPLIVFTAIPLAMIGAVLALLITGNTFSFTAFVGLTSLVGIVVNNSIILVDYTNQLRRDGVGAREALQRAGETRFLPIVLTTGTTIGGLLPLTLQGGTMWAPMGWTIIGGLIVSTILTLVVVPVLYNFYTPENTFKKELPEGGAPKALIPGSAE